MRDWTRRDVLKTGLAAPAVATAAGEAVASEQAQAQTGTRATGAERERLLLDFGWRFQLRACR